MSAPSSSSSSSLCDGVMFLRHELAPRGQLQAPPTPTLLFSAGTGTGTGTGAREASGAESITTAAPRLYWARVGHCAPAAVTGGAEWRVECAPLRSLQHIDLGRSGAGVNLVPAAGSTATAAAAAVEERCTTLRFEGGSPPPLCLEAASPAARTAFVAQLLSLLRQEAITGVQLHGDDNRTMTTTAQLPPAQRADPIHQLLTRLHSSAAQSFNAAAAATPTGASVQISPSDGCMRPRIFTSPPATQQVHPATSMANHAASSSATVASASDPHASAHPLLLQLSLRCVNAFGLTATASSTEPTATAAVLPYTSATGAASASRPYLSELAVAAFERHALSGKLSYLDHTELVSIWSPAGTGAGVGAGAATCDRDFEKQFRVWFHAGTGQQLLLSLYDVGLGRSAEEKAARAANRAGSVGAGSGSGQGDELHVHERSRVGTAVLLLDDLMREHTHAASAVRKTASAAAAAATSTTAATAASLSFELTAPLLNYNNAAIAEQLQRQQSGLRVAVRVCLQGERDATAATHAPAATHAADAAAVAAASTAAPVAVAAAAAGVNPVSPSRVERSNHPESLLFRQKLNFFEAIGQEQWYNPSTGQAALVPASTDFVPTRSYWEQLRSRAEAEEAAQAAAVNSVGGAGFGGTTAAAAAAAATAAPATSATVVPAHPHPAAHPSPVPALPPGSQRALLQLQTSNLHRNGASYSTMAVLFSQESRTSALFTFIGHSEVLSSSREGALRFATVFRITYARDAHRSVLVHLYDGARAGALIEAGKSGGGGLGSLADDLLASFVLDMDDLAAAAPGALLVYAPQQVTQKQKQRFQGAGASASASVGQQEPRIMVAFTVLKTEEHKPLVAAVEPAATAAVVPVAAAAAVNKDLSPAARAAALLDTLSSGSTFTLFYPSSPVAAAAAAGAGGAAAPFPGWQGPRRPDGSAAAGMASVDLFVDTDERRIYWCAPGSRSPVPGCSVRISDLLAVVAGRHSSTLQASAHAAHAPDHSCLTILSLAGPDASPGADEPNPPPVVLDLAASGPRAREAWVEGLVLLVAQMCHGRALPVLHGPPDLEALERAHSAEAARALAARKQRQSQATRAAAEREASVAATARAPGGVNGVAVAVGGTAQSTSATSAVAAASRPAVSVPAAQPDTDDDEHELDEISTDDSDNEGHGHACRSGKHVKPAAETTAAKSSAAPAPASAAAPALAPYPTIPAVVAPPAAATSEPAAVPSQPPPVQPVTPPATAAAAVAATTPPPQPQPQAQPQAQAAPDKVDAAADADDAEDEDYFVPLPLSSGVEIHLRASASNLFGLDSSRESDMVLAVFQGCAAHDPSKPASAAGVAFSPAAVFRYALLDNSESVPDDLEPVFEKSFECELDGCEDRDGGEGASVGEQHLRLVVYDAAGDGVTAKDQLGLAWIDLRPLLRQALEQEERRHGDDPWAITSPSSHQLSLQLMHPTNPTLHAKLQSCHSQLHVDLQIRPLIRPTFVHRADAEAAAAEVAAAAAAASPSALAASKEAASRGVLAALLSQMRAGSFMHLHAQSETGEWHRSPLTLFAKEVLIEGEDAADAFHTLFWCERFSDQALAPGQAEECMETPGCFLPVFCISDIALGAKALCHEAFAAQGDESSAAAEDRLLVVSGANEPEEPDGEPVRVELALEAPSQQVRDMWGQNTNNQCTQAHCAHCGCGD